ncbi:hypothetical protein EVAR_56721_1 [Eumeta japonica]|uniref:Uncharacterized protein n=1 Tax=Eumeta variegata TaxID=151549 RepID=A0A4C1XXY0_EUMVA|nr:hypothetical protein EVAR_56721_1 [Eumeta japonica]
MSASILAVTARARCFFAFTASYYALAHSSSARTSSRCLDGFDFTVEPSFDDIETALFDGSATIASACVIWAVVVFSVTEGLLGESRGSILISSCEWSSVFLPRHPVDLVSTISERRLSTTAMKQQLTPTVEDEYSSPMK